MTLYHLVRNSSANPRTSASLREACRRRQVNYCEIEPMKFNPLAWPAGAQPGDLYYRSSSSYVSGINVRNIERLILQNDLVSLYGSAARAMYAYPHSYLIHSKAGLSIPLTIGQVSTNRALLQDYVQALHGLPIIIKVFGGSHGVGVMKVDSWETLYSVTDYLLAKHIPIVLRQYIAAATSARLIVLGTKIVGSLEYLAPTDDFRSNVGRAPQVKTRLFAAKVNRLAVAAVATLDLNFGGVDILIDQAGQPYVVEVNFPCNFSRAEQVAGQDIAGQIVDYLVKKAEHYA